MIVKGLFQEPFKREKVWGILLGVEVLLYSVYVMFKGFLLVVEKVDKPIRQIVDWCRE